MSMKKFKDKKIGFAVVVVVKPKKLVSMSKSKKSSYLKGLWKLGGQLPNLFIILNPQDSCSANYPFTYIYSYTNSIYCMSMKKIKLKKNRLRRRRQIKHEISGV